MMRGIAASSSIAVPSGRFSQVGDSSVRKQRDAEADRDGDDHRDGRGHQRAEDRHQRAEFLLDRVPVVVDQETKSRTCAMASWLPISSDTRIAGEDAEHQEREKRVRFSNALSIQGAERSAAVLGGCLSRSVGASERVSVAACASGSGKP